MWIVRLALRRTYTFVVMALLMLAVSYVAINRMSTDIFPEINIPVVSVVWQYTGMPADEIEQRIILINERVLTTSVNDIEHIESQSLFGVGVIRIYFYPGARIEAAVAQVTATSQAILKVMPPGINPPYIVQYSATSVPIVQIAVSSDTLTEEQIFDKASNFIIQRLGVVQGARVPQPWGGKWPQVMVDLDLNQLYGRGLSPQDVQNAINSQNLIVPSGTAKIGDTEYYVKLNSSPSRGTMDEMTAAFNNMPVKTVNGVPIYVKDVANVHMGYAVQTNVVRRDGRRAVLMTILKGEGASSLDVVERLREALPGIQAQMPPELHMELLFDQSVFVRAAIEGVIWEGAIAAGLTALMILVFLGSWRSTLIVAVSIPLSILTSIIVLWALGQSLNIMTLGGLALAVGVLVDDATVELENVHRNFGADKPIRQAILDGASQIATPALVSTLAICIVFVPVLFLTGPAASLFYPLALAVVFAILTSYLLSRTLVPTMVLYMLPIEVPLYTDPERSVTGGGPIWQFHRRFEVLFERLRSAYEGLLAVALNRPLLTLVLMLGFAACSLGLAPWLGEDFFPAVDAGQFRLHMRAPSATRVEETERVFGKVENVIREIVPAGEREMILDNFGLTPSFTTRAYIDNGTVTDGDGEILVALKPDHGPTASYVARLREELPKRFPDCTFFFEPADITSQILDFGLPAPIDVQVVGVLREENLPVAKKLCRELAKIPGIADVHIHQITDYATLRIDVDRILASELGLTQQSVTVSVLVSLSGTTQVTPNYWVNPLNRVNYPLAVQTPPGRVSTVDALMSTPIINGIAAASPSPTPSTYLAPTIPGTPGPGVPGQPIAGVSSQQQPQLLSNISQMRRGTSEAVVSHYNVQPVFEVLADVQGRDLGAVSGDVQRVVKALGPDLPRGSTFAVRGQVQSMNSSYRGLAYGMLFAVLLVYFLMVVNFQSWLDPFIVLTGLPGALAGIVWMLYLTQTTVSVPALMGAIMCIGVATSNSILLVTFANEQRAEIPDAKSAALSAGGIRLRPVLMTALAMIIGMLPMSLGLGDGGEQNAPLGRAVIGGLLLATVFTLLFVPVMYSLLRREPPRREEEVGVAS
jgi:multidrug efflux pump subunit AcrB